MSERKSLMESERDVLTEDAVLDWLRSHLCRVADAQPLPIYGSPCIPSDADYEEIKARVLAAFRRWVEREHVFKGLPADPREVIAQMVLLERIEREYEIWQTIESLRSTDGKLPPKL